MLSFPRLVYWYILSALLFTRRPNQEVHFLKEFIIKNNILGSKTNGSAVKNIGYS